LLAPCEPTKIVVVGLNYAEHAHELAYEIPGEPMISIKPASAVIGPFDAIVYPKSSTRVDPEAELAVVIGKHAHECQRPGWMNIFSVTRVSTMLPPGIFNVGSSPTRSQAAANYYAL
jgi:2-keto-4-pentenoate hydratase/2-oxohepta-3-ene-1,7-dioic acid hydratase in catechol pathway